jgi:hypothetical protein
MGSLELEMRYVLQDGSTVVTFNEVIQRIANVTSTERRFHVENMMFFLLDCKVDMLPKVNLSQTSAPISRSETRFGSPLFKHQGSVFSSGRAKRQTLPVILRTLPSFIQRLDCVRTTSRRILHWTIFWNFDILAWNFDVADEAHERVGPVEKVLD